MLAAQVGRDAFTRSSRREMRLITFSAGTPWPPSLTLLAMRAWLSAALSR
jgi:hypothetical protein